MRRRYQVFMVLLFIVFSSFKSIDPPVVFNKLSVKLSEIKTVTNGKVKFKFEFTNKTKKPIKILDVHTSCTCTMGAHTQGEILPEKKGYVELTTNVESLKQNLQVDGVIKLNTDHAPFYKVSIVYDK